MNLFIWKDNEQHGPFTEEEVRQETLKADAIQEKHVYNGLRTFVLDDGGTK